MLHLLNPLSGETDCPFCSCEDKPPISDLHYFLDFQSHKIWAPVHNDLPLGPSTNVASSSSALHLNFLGPKLYVNTSQVAL